MPIEKTLGRELVVALVLALISILCAGDSFAFRASARPFNILLTGTIIPHEEKGDVRTFNLKAGEKMWRFQITYAFNRGSSSVTGWRILQDLFPRELNLFGDQKIIQPLMHPDVVGKKFELKGRLYLRSNKYYVSSVTEILEESEQSESE